MGAAFLHFVDRSLFSKETQLEMRPLTLNWTNLEDWSNLGIRRDNF